MEERHGRSERRTAPDAGTGARRRHHRRAARGRHQLRRGLLHVPVAAPTGVRRRPDFRHVLPRAQGQRGHRRRRAAAWSAVVPAVAAGLCPRLGSGLLGGQADVLARARRTGLWRRYALRARSVAADAGDPAARDPRTAMIPPEPSTRCGAVRLAGVGAVWITASLAAILAAAGDTGQGSAPGQAAGSYAWVGTVSAQ